MALDVALFHAYRLADDPREQEIMRPFAPLGLQYLVAWLRRETPVSVDWFDATFAPSLDALAAEIAAERPKLVGLYGHTITRPDALRMLRTVTEHGPRVIAGGPDPAQYPDEYLDGGVEVIVVGEGELTVQALVEHLEARGWRWDRAALADVPGILFRDDAGHVVRTAPRPLIKPLDRLPWPHREHRDLDRYTAAWRARHGVTALSLNTSRGCPFHCNWCSKAVYGDTYRRRPIDDVIDEILWLREEFDPDQLWFIDDVFTINRNWVLRFCDQLVARGAAMPFYVVARPQSLDRELVAALADAGCYRIYISAESGAQHILDAMDKHTAVEDIFEAGRFLREAGIELGVFVMIGYPGEELDDIRATLRMLNHLDPAVTLLSVAHPMKGTTFYDNVAHLVVHPEGWEEQHGGRLAFKQRFSHKFYDIAQRYIWTETGLRRKLKRGELDVEAARLAVKYPAYRLAFEVLGRQPGSWE